MLLLVLAAAAALSYVGAAYPADLTLHHAGTAAGFAVLVWTMRRAPLSDRSFARCVAFLVLHVLAAHWLYTFVPYDEWTQSLLGFRVTDTFDLRRNHFDRLVHFAFGALLVGVVREIAEVRGGVRRAWARAIAVDAVLSTSAVYELFEWLLAVAASPDRAERYNGQQGDAFDAQKDMAFAAAGALVVTFAEWLLAQRTATSRERRRRGETV